MKLVTSKKDIIAHDKRFWKITKNLPLRTGSLLRIRKESLHRYGIDISRLSGKEVEELRKFSETYHRIDLEDQEQQPKIDGFLQTEWREDRRREMSQYTGQTVKELLKSMVLKKDHIRVAEIPARQRPACFSVAVALWNDPDVTHLLDSATFELVNFDIAKMQSAIREMERYHVHDVNANWKKTDMEFLSSQKDGSIDIIITLMHLHKKAYLSDYLMEVRRVLSDEGVLVIGDWHSTLFDHPVNTFDFLTNTMGTHSEANEIRKLLGPELMRPDPNVGLTPEEINANKVHLAYLNEVYRTIQEANLGLPPRIHIFGSYRTSADQMEELGYCGFETDIETIKGNFQESNLVDSPVRLLVDPIDQKLTDFAVFMIAQKKKDQGG
jgi:hypothetical protein